MGQILRAMLRQENRSDDQGLVDFWLRGTQAEGSECVLFNLNYLKVISDRTTRASDEIRVAESEKPDSSRRLVTRYSSDLPTDDVALKDGYSHPSASVRGFYTASLESGPLLSLRKVA